ncbi:carboxylating nicotinate-nucleotide diphosphorylase [Streptococcus halichoeri]|uniref:carboxylating nicotinate-nucleotide diphosphorylase n=1 Tax=Streptococcus halichoeri TaxID=254785 RepID=UPI001356CC55|nr:carboxylating nicotinate-nucleotide diphosphorylase [Streptococcus halichoeri]
MYPQLNNFQIDDVLIRALQEDVNSEDFSTNAIFDNPKLATISLIAKEAGLLAGLDVFKRVFQLYDAEVSFSDSPFEDGSPFQKGDKILEVVGKVSTLLTCERVALNFLQRMSGIASLADAYIKALDDPSIKVFDTRKTTPNLRLFEKYAVRVGGAYNHRFNLSDAIMLKDNHINAAGSVTTAITKAKQYAPFIKQVEIEVETLEEVQEAVAAKADIIMLDNMNLELIKKAISIINKQAIIEVSGNITLDNIATFKGLEIDYISSGSLTHNASSIDFSMKQLRYLD